MSLVERALSKLFRHRVFGDGYMDRWHICGYYAPLPTIFGHNIFINKISRPDLDADPHDHPWDFWSFVLKGGYVEENYVSLQQLRHRTDDDKPYALLRRVGCLDFRSGDHVHRIIRLPNGPSWTFIVSREKHRKWGFWTREGWVYWRDYRKAEKTDAHRNI